MHHSVYAGLTFALLPCPALPARLVHRYAGIYLATICLLVGQHRVLFMPLAAFRDNPELLDGVVQYRAILQSLAVQLFFELITDALCVAYEARRGLDPVAVWRRLPKLSLLPGFALMGAWATLTGTFRVFFGDDLSACVGMDMCWCAGGFGLRPDGIREAYCTVLYANNSGRPPVA
jgi:hypothetical protein